MRNQKRKSGTKIHFGLFARINLYVIISVFVVMIIICILLTYSLVYPGLHKDKLLYQEATEQLSRVATQKYTAIFNQFKLLHNTDHTASRIANHENEDNYYFSFDDIRFISDYLTALHFSDDQILDAIIIPMQGGNNFSSSAITSRRINVSYDYQSLPEVKQLLASPKNISITYSNVQPYISSSNEQLITFAVKIYNPTKISQKEIVGIMLVNYPLSVFFDAYQELGSLTDGLVYIVNNQKDIVFSTDEELLGLPYQKAFEDNAVVSKTPITTSGLQIITVMPNDYIQTATWNMIWSLLRILIPAMLIISILIYFFNRQYQRRIDNLSKTIQNFQSDGSNIPIDDYYNDELGQLALQFNEMCSRLNAQIKLRYKAEVARKTAELNALQAQINPHFLYNTIESIRMCAIENNDPEVSDMLIQLGRLFHWMIQLDKQIVYLEDEIEYNESYLNLQSLRYQDSFHSQFSVQEEALYLGIPKFTLQPIIENALRHGLHDNGIAGQIEVTAFIQDTLLIVKVCDNGCGMQPDTLARLQQHITSDITSPQYGIGMRNVHSRIQMLFGPAYGINVDSTPNLGTTATITLPAIAKKEMEERIEQDRRGAEKA